MTLSLNLHFNKYIYCLYILFFYIIYGDSINDNNNKECDCYTISLESVSESNNDDNLICYSYLINYDYNNDQCKSRATSIIFGVCDNDNSDLFQQTLKTSIININPKQQLFESYKSDHFLGVNIEKFNNDKVVICMKNMEQISFTTSNNIQLILENDDIITCQSNDRKQNGLPCFYTKDDNTNAMMISPLINDENHDILIENKGLSVTTRQYIQFIFVTILIIIFLNAMCCVFLALRQSGNLDKYFDQIDSDQQDDDDDIDDDIDYDIDDNDDYEYDHDESPPIPQSFYNQNINYSDLVIMKNNDHNNDDDDGNLDKYTIEIAHSPYKE